MVIPSVLVLTRRYLSLSERRQAAAVSSDTLLLAVHNEAAVREHTARLACKLSKLYAAFLLLGARDVEALRNNPDVKIEDFHILYISS